MKRTKLYAAVMAVATFAAISGASAAGECHKGSPGVVNIIDWSIEPIDDTINYLTVTFESALPKHIRMIDATAGFTDALGGAAGWFALERDAEFSEIGQYTETGRWGPSTFERLLDLKHDEVATFVCVRSVLYEDGSKQEF